MKYIVDIKGEIEGDYEIIGKYEERPQGDLISREALKAEVALMFGDKTHITESVCELIDNAPTVSDRYEEGYSQGYIDGSTGADWKGGAEND